MKIYSGFASVYDALMYDAPYGEWARQIDAWASVNEKPSPEEAEPGSVGKEDDFSGGNGRVLLDLGCGTGSISVIFSKMGYSVIGVDISEDMLGVAYKKSRDNGCDILFVNQDIAKLDLYGTVDVCVSVCDVMNYILETEKLQRVFNRVSLFMNPGGVFVFDMNTLHKFRDKLMDKTFAGTGAGGESYVWENNFCEKSMVNTYDVVFGKGKRSFRERHLQRAYESCEIIRMLHEAGFVSVQAKDGYSENPLSVNSLRAVYVARKGL